MIESLGDTIVTEWLATLSEDVTVEDVKRLADLIDAKVESLVPAQE